MRAILVGLMTAFVGCASSPSAPAQPIEDGQLVYGYASEYVAFAGWAEDGTRAAFVIDCNRGRNGNALQGQVLAGLFVDDLGVVPLEGLGEFYPRRFPETTGAPWFPIQGTIKDGLSVVSEGNALSLKTQPMTVIERYPTSSPEYLTGSAEAEFIYAGRRFSGRAAVESLRLIGTNPLAHPEYFSMPRLTTIFAVSQDGHELAFRDFEKLGPLRRIASPPPKRSARFALPGQPPQALSTFDWEPRARRWRLGAFTWPTAWRFRSGGVELNARALDQYEPFWFGYGAFAFVFLEGELVLPSGESVPVFGLAEVLDYWR